VDSFERKRCEGHQIISTLLSKEEEEEEGKEMGG
jgi:hypothetical protein